MHTLPKEFWAFSALTLLGAGGLTFHAMLLWRIAFSAQVPWVWRLLSLLPPLTPFIAWAYRMFAEVIIWAIFVIAYCMVWWVIV